MFVVEDATPVAWSSSSLSSISSRAPGRTIPRPISCRASSTSWKIACGVHSTDANQKRPRRVQPGVVAAVVDGAKSEGEHRKAGSVT